MLMALQAGASGMGWTPVPGLIGSDLLKVRPDFKVVDDPYAGSGRVVLVPALRPEFALVHARRADERGNLVIGTTYDDRLMVQAARTVIATVERIAPDATERLHGDEQVLPASFVDVVAVAPYESTGRATVEYLETVRAVRR
jgi:glutaconate CoA-transferase, subunit A